MENEDKTCVMPSSLQTVKVQLSILMQPNTLVLFKKHVKINVIFTNVFMY